MTTKEFDAQVALGLKPIITEHPRHEFDCVQMMVIPEFQAYLTLKFAGKEYSSKDLSCPWMRELFFNHRRPITTDDIRSAFIKGRVLTSPGLREKLSNFVMSWKGESI